jgi:hypothetical protein
MKKDRAEQIDTIMNLVKAEWMRRSSESLGKIIYNLAQRAKTVTPYFMTDQQLQDVLTNKDGSNESK